MIKKLAEAWLKSELEKRLKAALNGQDPRTVPHGTVIPAKTGWDFGAFGRDIEVDLGFRINDRKPKR